MCTHAICTRLETVASSSSCHGGCFVARDAPAAAYPDLLAVSLRAPRAVVCLLSAAAVNDLTDEIPMAVQIAVPRRTWPPKLDHPPVEVSVWDPATFELGLDSVEVAPGERRGSTRQAGPPST